MSTPSAAAATEEWLPKEEAAHQLGVSTRQIERHAASGRIRTSKVRLEGDRSDRTVYSGQDLARVRQEREAGVLQLAPRAHGPYVEQQAFADIITAMMPAFSPRPARLDKFWMTLDEAAGYCGLPASILAELIRTHAIHALGRGVKTWRVQRSSLDKWSTSEFTAI